MRKSSKTLSLILVLSFLLSSCLIGCGKKKEESGLQSQSDSIVTVKSNSGYFQSNDVELIIPKDSDKEINQVELNAYSIFGDRIVVACSTSYAYTKEIEKKIKSHTSDPSETVDPSEWQSFLDELATYRWQGLLIYDFSGNLVSQIEMEDENDIIYSLAEGRNGEILTLIGSSETWNNRLSSVSSEGKEEKLFSLTDIAIDRQSTVEMLDNEIYLITNTSEYGTWDKNGKALFRHPTDGFRSTLFNVSGKWYATGADHNEDYSQFSSYAQEINITNGQTTPKKIQLNDQMPEISSKGDWGCLGISPEGILKLYPLENKVETMISWKDTDVNYTQVIPETLRILENNEVCFLQISQDPGEPSNSNKKHIFFTRLTPSDTNPHEGKPVLTIGTIGGTTSSVFMDYVNAYNKDPDSKCQIVVSDLAGNYNNNYMTQISKLAEITDQIYLDMQNGSGPDILFDFSSYSLFSTERVLCDLNSFIDGNNGLDRSLYFDSVFRASEMSGKLYHIPVFFILYGVYVNSDHMGNQRGWTFDEFDQKASALPDDVVCIPHYTYDEFLMSILQGSLKDFIDYDKKEAYFDSAEFRNLLETVKKYGHERTNSEFYDHYEQLREGMLASFPSPVSNIDEYLNIIQSAKGNLIYAGWPTAQGKGPCITPGMSLSISQFSEHKEEAWDFIKYLFNTQMQLQLCKSTTMPGIPLSREAVSSLNNESSEKSKENYAIYEQNKQAYIDNDWTPPILVDDNAINSYIQTIESVGTSALNDRYILNIISEEAPAYFNDQKTLDDVCKIIQNRVSLYVKEK